MRPLPDSTSPTATTPSRVFCTVPIVLPLRPSRLFVPAFFLLLVSFLSLSLSQGEGTILGLGPLTLTLTGLTLWPVSEILPLLCSATLLCSAQTGSAFFLWYLLCGICGISHLQQSYLIRTYCPEHLRPTLFVELSKVFHISAVLPYLRLLTRSQSPVTIAVPEHLCPTLLLNCC
jgi:hypothetical protein